MPELIPPVDPGDGTTDGAPALDTRSDICPRDIETQSGAMVCQRCAPREHTHCSRCHEWYHRSVNCRWCFSCDRCHEPVPSFEFVYTIRGSRICANCRIAAYRQCDTCEGWNRDGNTCANGCCDPDTCDGCADCADSGIATLVHDYSYRPRPVFHGDGPLYLGSEIEIEVPHHRAEECVAVATEHLKDLGYLKEDASIRHGFEIVTHPMSYQWAMANFPWRMLTHLRHSGCDVSDKTGIHVHISRAGFDSPSHVFRWMKLIYRNQQQVTTMAGRHSSDWAAFTAEDREAVKHYAKGTHGRDRYRAINTTNWNTFELRIFASSLDPCQVQAALAFTSASVEYTRELTADAIAHRGGWTWPAFVDWLTNRTAYAPLLDQLEELECVC